MPLLKLLTNFTIFFFLFSLINTQVENDTKENNKNKKASNKWTTQELIKYTLKNHGKDNYFICDPLNYISEDEKEVIYYRLEAIYNKLNMTTVFFILDKISLEGLNITKIEDEEFEDEDDEIVYKKNNTINNNNNNNSTNITLNNTLVKTEEQRQREFMFYIAEVRKKLFNRKIFKGRESKCLMGIYTVDDLGKYLYVGRDYNDMINQDEIKYLLEGKEYFIEQKNIYIAVDNLFSNFVYRYSPSKLDKFNKFVGFLGELLGLGAIIFSYYIMNRKKEQPQRHPNPNNDEKKDENKNNQENNDKQKEEKKDNLINEKEKQE